MARAAQRQVRRRVAGLAALVVVVGVAVPATVGTQPAAAGATQSMPVLPPVLPYDFNGDGYAEVVSGVPGELLHGGFTDAPGAGVAHVLRSTSQGVTADGNQLWSQDSPGVLDEAEDGQISEADFAGLSDNFGAAFASGDFDGDRFADLAVGVPNEEQVDGVQSGAVNVLYGSAQGLTAERNQLFWQSGGVMGTAGDGDRFGAALAVGDFDGDRVDELAVGVPRDQVGGRSAGRVVVLRGSPSGLTEEGAVAFDQGTAGVPSAPGDGDRFGASLATGRLAGDYFHADLVIGVPGETVNGRVGAGVVHVLPGSEEGLTAAGSTLWHQDRAQVRGAAEPGDELGYDLAVGDFDADGPQDLAVAVANENGYAGAVNVLYGAPAGNLSPARNQILSQDTPGVPGADERTDYVRSLAAGDLGGHPGDELVIGQPGEDVAGRPGYDHGALLVLQGSATGLTATGSRLWTQDTAGVPGAAESGDTFGSSVAVRSLGRGGQRDLLVAAQGEAGSSGEGMGVVHVLYGSAAGPTTTGTQLWGQDSAGVPETAETHDLFGVLGD